MKVGNIINGLTVTDVKRVNKLNLIQFLKEVDSYLQKGYKLDVTSGRQVGLVLMADLYKTEAASSVKVGSTGVDSNDVSSVGEQTPTESIPEESVVPETVVTESTVQQDRVTDEAVVEPVVDTVKEEAPVAPKKTTTRSKKTAQ